LHVYVDESDGICVDTKCLEAISNMCTLRELEVDRCPAAYTEQGAHSITQLTALETLSFPVQRHLVTQDPSDEEKAMLLYASMPSLTRLNLTNITLSPAAASALARHPHLSSLLLGRCTHSEARTLLMITSLSLASLFTSSQGRVPLHESLASAVWHNVHLLNTDLFPPGRQHKHEARNASQLAMHLCATRLLSCQCAQSDS
jgi:hypothetical protein